MDNYAQVQWIGYFVSGTSFIAAIFFYFFAKIPDKFHLLQKEKENDFVVIKDEILIHTTEKMEVEAYVHKKNENMGRTADFKYVPKRFFRTTKLSG